MGKKDTKLLACAGSGKTRCIIARMNRLIKKDIYDDDEIMMLTFTRFTKDDFINKIKSYKAKHVDPNCVKTIDSFAKSLIDPDNTVDVSLLSLRFKQFIENKTKKEINEFPNLKKIKIIFVDEAQDLNEIQYNILIKMKEKLGIIINLIGDRNQNIYQFRGSSDKYLGNFKAKEFKLTRNFRSHQCIIDFSQSLRAYTDMDVKCMKGSNDYTPMLLFYNGEQEMESQIMEILNNAIEMNMELSDFAILSPTRGRMGQQGRSHGLCLISNILYQNDIKFKQFYEESTEEVSGTGITYQPEDGHVNILTYMGSKGLEWKYVIILDADLCLINKRFLDDEKHAHDQYLLYVACSRAIEHMFIFSRYNYRKGTKSYSTNPHLEKVSPEFYQMNLMNTKNLKFPKIEYRNMGNKENKVTKLINRMNEYDLDNMSNLLNYENRNKVLHKNIYQDYTDLKCPHSMFLGKYIEMLFHTLCDLKCNKPRKEVPDITTIINSYNGSAVVEGYMPMSAVRWYNKNKSNYTWKKFNKDDDIDSYIKNFITKKFNKKIKFKKHVIIQDEHYKEMVLSERKWVKKYYNKYLKCKNKKKLRKYVFYIVLMKHAFDTQHYFHIKQRGSKFKEILKTHKKLFKELEEFVDEMDYTFTKSNYSITGEGLVGEVDILDSKDKIWEIKCVDEISLRNFIQVTLYNIMCDDNLLGHDYKKTVKYTIRFLNLLKGEMTHYKIILERSKIDEILDIFYTIGELKPDKIDENATVENTVIKTGPFAHLKIIT